MHYMCACVSNELVSEKNVTSHHTYDDDVVFRQTMPMLTKAANSVVADLHRYQAPTKNGAGARGMMNSSLL